MTIKYFLKVYPPAYVEEVLDWANMFAHVASA